MSMVVSSGDIGVVWIDLLRQIHEHGHVTGPRDMLTKELVDVTVHVSDAYNNVLVSGERRPNYRFMVAEWLWMWFGRNDVATISRFNPKIAEYSDDGLTFKGAYGPHLLEQFYWVLGRLQQDSATRQAVIEIPRVRESTKDQPCTLSMQFLIRHNRLQTIVTMRSSDVWLGLPYDFFNFTMIANIFAYALALPLGWVTFHLGSSHLYEDKFPQALTVLNGWAPGYIRSPQLPSFPPPSLEVLLAGNRSNAGELGILPWFYYAAALDASNTQEAMRCLQHASPTTNTFFNS